MATTSRVPFMSKPIGEAGLNVASIRLEMNQILQTEQPGSRPEHWPHISLQPSGDLRRQVTVPVDTVPGLMPRGIAHSVKRLTVGKE